ncbi:hypothetical protein ACQ4M3_38810 [Leptolyngbya sp. AN03gr2]
MTVMIGGTTARNPVLKKRSYNVSRKHHTQALFTVYSFRLRSQLSRQL